MVYLEKCQMNGLAHYFKSIILSPLINVQLWTIIHSIRNTDAISTFMVVRRDLDINSISSATAGILIHSGLPL